jgi:hypothetical protein
VIEAFHHAAAANDVERAERLIAGDGIPRHFRGAATAILDWLESLPPAVLNARPSLWWRHASLLLVNGQTTGVEEKLQAAEAALQNAKADDKAREARDWVGRIAASRAVLALTRYDVETMLAESRRALEYLHPGNLSVRTRQDFTQSGLKYDLIFQLGGMHSPSHCRRALTPKGRLVLSSGDSDGRWIGPVDRIIKAAVLSPFVSQTLGALDTKRSKKDLEHLKDLIEASKLTPVINQTHSLSEVPEAIRYVEKGPARGKVVISLEHNNKTQQIWRN